MSVCLTPKLSLSKKRKFESLQKKLKPKNENNEDCVGCVKWVCSNNEEWKWPHAVICRLSVKWCYAVICRLPWNDALLWSADFPWNDAMLWSAEFREIKLCCNLPIAVICRLPWNEALLWSADFPWCAFGESRQYVFCFGLEYIFGNVIFVNRANIISRRIKQASN